MAGEPEQRRRFNRDFPDLIQGFELATLDKDPHTIFALSPDLTFIYFNPAWFRFAADNHGEPALSRKFRLGTTFAAALPPVLHDFYIEAYTRVVDTGKPWQHEYECSSPERFRVYHQTVYPFRNGQGLLVVNSLCEERGHINDYRPPHPPDAGVYRSRETGLITQCCNCRRTQRCGEPERWDWVPAWVARMPHKTTSGLCQLCYEYYWKYRQT